MQVIRLKGPAKGFKLPPDLRVFQAENTGRQHGGVLCARTADGDRCDRYAGGHLSAGQQGIHPAEGRRQGHANDRDVRVRRYGARKCRRQASHSDDDFESSFCRSTSEFGGSLGLTVRR